VLAVKLGAGVKRRNEPLETLERPQLNVAGIFGYPEPPRYVVEEFEPGLQRDGQHDPVTCHAPQLRKRPARLVEVLQDLAADDHIERIVGEGERQKVADMELRR
jgi:hypothetical protein